MSNLVPLAPAGNGQDQAPVLRLLAASQPDIIRSTQKDDLYLQQTADACHDLVRRVAGAYPALQYSRETQLAAELLYHGLTTGVGMPTLGEEYCSMSQVTGDGMPPSVPRRLALVALRAVGPYLATSVAARLEAAHQQSQWDQGSGEEGAGGSATHDPNEQHAARAGSAAGAWTSGRSYEVGQGSAQAASSSRGTGRAGTGGVLGAVLSRLRTGWSSGLRSLVARWPQLQPVLSGAARGHLAVFYVYGVYYLLWHRLAGIRYISTSRPLQGRPTYKLLGWALLGQLGLSALLALQRTVLHAAAAQRAAAGGVPLAQAHGQHAVMLDESEQQLQAEGQAAGTSAGECGCTSEDGAQQAGTSGQGGGSGQAVGPKGSTWQVATEASHVSRGTCALCLNTRNHPTSTPCGHVFCWACVAAWCNEKPECPLCRAKVLPPQLVPLHHCSLF